MSVLEKLQGYVILQLYRWKEKATFDKVRIIRGAMVYEECTLFLGFTSQAPAFIPETSACMLIDDGAEFDPGYACAVFSRETDLLSLYDDINILLQDEKAGYRGSYELLQALITDKGLTELVKIGAELMGNPLMVMDEAFNLLAVSTREEQEDPYWMDFLNYGYCTPERVYTFRSRGYARLLAESRHPVIIGGVEPGSPRSLAHKITSNNKIMGYLGCLEKNRAFSHGDIETAEKLAKVFAAEMKKTRSYDNFIGGMYEHLILKLLDGQEKDTRLAAGLSAFSGRHFRYFCMAVIPIVRNDALKNQVQYLRISIENASRNFHTAFYDNNVVILISLRKLNDFEPLMEKLSEILEVHQLACGLSFYFEDITQMKRHYHEALRAADISRFIVLPQRIYAYESLMLYDLLLSAEKNTPLENYSHPALPKVAEYDKACGTDYFQTLYIYLKTGGDITASAKKLNIHRNTMVHRMEKLFEITGLDLEDGEVRTQLMMTYKIMEITGFNTKVK